MNYRRVVLRNYGYSSVRENYFRSFLDLASFYKLDIVWAALIVTDQVSNGGDEQCKHDTHVTVTSSFVRMDVVAKSVIFGMATSKHAINTGHWFLRLR